MTGERRPLRASVIAAALMAVLVAGVVKLVLWLPGAIERVPARAKAFDIPEDAHQEPVKFLTQARLALEKAETVTVHWLFFSPAERGLPDDVRGKPTFHGYPILGSVAVKSKQAGQQILESVFAHVDPDLATGCFDPQHGVEVKLADGRSIDLVICYHCFQMEIFDESGDHTYVGVGTASEPLLSEQLKTGGVEYVDRLGQFLRSQADNS